MIGIIFSQDIRYCPYLGRYTEILRQAGVPFDIIWWERWEKPPETALPDSTAGAEKFWVFNKASEMTRSPFAKIGDFAAFSRFVRGVIRNRKYEKLIILTTLTGIFIEDVLLSKYRGKFLFDIRDYSYERYGLFKGLEAKLIDASEMTCISSEGFKQFLPEGRPYVICDNFVESDIKLAGDISFQKKKPGEKIELSYIGFIRYFDENRKILDRMYGDDRFHISYHGAGSDFDRLTDYRREKKWEDLEITGYFDYTREKADLCRKADIINNFYPKSLEIQRLATSNKTYDGIIFRRPQLVSSGTFSEELVKRWGIGCALDITQHDFADRLYDYYMRIDEREFNANAEKALSEVRARDTVYRKQIESFIRQ